MVNDNMMLEVNNQKIVAIAHVNNDQSINIKTPIIIDDFESIDDEKD